MKRKFILNGLLLTAVSLVVRTVGLALGAYIGKTVGAEAVGLNGLIMTVYSFSVTLATSGVGLTVTRLVASALAQKGKKEAASVLWGAVLYSLFFGALSLLLLLLLARPLAEIAVGDIRAYRAFTLLSLSLLPTALSGVAGGYFIAVRRVGRNAALQIIGQGARIGFTVLFLTRVQGMGAEEAVCALALGITLTEWILLLVSAALFFFDVIRHGLFTLTTPALGRVSGMAMPLAFSAYVRSLLLTLEHSIIPSRLKMHGLGKGEALSEYGALHGMAVPTVLYPMTPITAYSGLLVPELAAMRVGSRRMSHIAKDAVKTTLRYCAVASVAMLCFAEDIGYLVYGSYSAGRYIALLAPIIPIMYLDHVTDAMLKGIGEQVYSMWVNIADSLISIALVFVLLPIMGASGYAAVIMIMELFNFTLSYARLKKRVRIGKEAFSAITVPLICSLSAMVLTRLLFGAQGSSVTVAITVGKVIFYFASSYCLWRLISPAVHRMRASGRSRAKASRLRLFQHRGSASRESSRRL